VLPPSIRNAAGTRVRLLSSSSTTVLWGKSGTADYKLLMDCTYD